MAARGRIHLSTHVTALAGSRDKEALAEELLQKQEHNLELQQQLVSGRQGGDIAAGIPYACTAIPVRCSPACMQKRLMTDNRHLEVEVNSSRQALQQALKQQQQQQQGQPGPA